jgi:peptidoglycan hydrolase-like protein with peptidoglycan-binding domain
MTVAQLQTLLASLEAQLVSLEAQAGSNNANGNVSSATTSNFVFTRDLQLGMTGNDVKQLQLFLIAQNSGAAAQKLKTNGATTYFGLLTKSALIEFQKKEKITPASGYFGLKTRAWIAK